MTTEEREVLKRKIILKEQLIEWTKEEIKEMKEKLEAENNGN